MGRWSGLVLVLLLVSQVVWAADFAMNELPDFSDQQQWSEVEAKPLAANIRGSFYVWGTIKKYRLRQDQSIVGYEEFPYGSLEPYFKTWGRETAHPFYALRESPSGPWQVGLPGDSWWEVRFDFDSSGRIRGTWVVLFVRSNAKAFGRYLVDPKYQAPKRDIQTRR